MKNVNRKRYMYSIGVGTGGPWPPTFPPSYLPIQVNVIQKGHIRIIENAKETSSDSGMYKSHYWAT